MPAKRKRKTFEELTVAELQALHEESEKLASEKQESTGAIDIETQGERLKRAAFAQFAAQMLPLKDLSETESNKLKGAGRDITVTIPNVTVELLAHLKLDNTDEHGAQKDRFADSLFDGKTPERPQSNGAFLKLGRVLSVKYVKRVNELRLSGSYKWHPKAKPKRAAKPKDKAASDAPGAEDVDDDAGEEAEAAGAASEAASEAAGEAAADEGGPGAGAEPAEAGAGAEPAEQPVDNVD